MEETLERLDCEHHDKETKLGEEVKKEKSKLSKILIALELQKPRNWEQEYLNLHEEYNQKVHDCWNAASPQERKQRCLDSGQIKSDGDYFPLLESVAGQQWTPAFKSKLQKEMRQYGLTNICLHHTAYNRAYSLLGRTNCLYVYLSGEYRTISDVRSVSVRTRPWAPTQALK